MQVYLETKSSFTLAPIILDKLDRSCIRITSNRKYAGVIIRFAKSMPLSEIEHDINQEVITFWIGGAITNNDKRDNNIFMSWDEIIEHLNS